MLKSALKDEWEKISAEETTKLINSIPKRLQEVLERRVIQPGIKDSGLQERLLRENNLNVEKAIEIVRAAKASREQIRNMKYDAATINFVGRIKTSLKPNTTGKSVDENTSLESVQRSGKFVPSARRKPILLLNVSRVQRTFIKMNVSEDKLVYVDFVNENETKWAMKNSTDSNFMNVEMDNAVPVIHPPRRIPLALQPKLKSTLDRLEKEGIVSKVNKPTDWVQSLVIVENPLKFKIMLRP
ncbi:uncharacterized protein TNCV_3118481 [Trichonephila clavipes]|uniref:Reverse transcriptase n=1 Tax=Trichonephila clavipes TaxID=2585209 RepID=A0A8X6W9B9_TRICX|nr:uncharacterized protein TNCV_3118481 [Trichonephila clavipes]